MKYLKPPYMPPHNSQVGSTPQCPLEKTVFQIVDRMQLYHTVDRSQRERSFSFFSSPVKKEEQVVRYKSLHNSNPWVGSLVL